MYSINDCEILNLPKVHNDAGDITFVENGNNVPFNVRRIFYLYDVPMGTIRGGHAHYELDQCIVAASGSFTFVLDDGKEKREVFLNNPSKALHVRGGIWGELKEFSSGSICLVLASHIYIEADYIRDYQLFLKYRNNA